MPGRTNLAEAFYPYAAGITAAGLQTRRGPLSYRLATGHGRPLATRDPSRHEPSGTPGQGSERFAIAKPDPDGVTRGTEPFVRQLRSSE